LQNFTINNNFPNLKKENKHAEDIINKNIHLSPAELEKSKVHIIVEILEYQPYHWFVYQTREEPYPFSLIAQMSFEETSSGTLIRGHVEFHGHGLFWDWFTPLIRLFFKSQEKSFYHFKQIMENTSKS